MIWAIPTALAIRSFVNSSLRDHANCVTATIHIACFGSFCLIGYLLVLEWIIKDKSNKDKTLNFSIFNMKNIFQQPISRFKTNIAM